MYILISLPSAAVRIPECLSSTRQPISFPPLLSLAHGTAGCRGVSFERVLPAGSAPFLRSLPSRVLCVPWVVPERRTLRTRELEKLFHPTDWNPMTRSWIWRLCRLSDRIYIIRRPPVVGLLFQEFRLSLQLAALDPSLASFIPLPVIFFKLSRTRSTDLRIYARRSSSPSLELELVSRNSQLDRSA